MASEGLTLPELQAVGEEIDVAPERIAEAAAAIELRRAVLLTGDLAEDVGGAVVLAMPGAAALGFDALRLGSWARDSELQM